MFTQLGGSLFILPVCYHPTTILSVDDDINFLENLSLTVSKKVALLCFDVPEKAIEYTKNEYHHLPFTTRCVINKDGGIKLDSMAIRNEIYNVNRFKEIIINVTDYDMPHTSGIELIKTMEFPPEVSQYSHIILTGKISAEFKEKLKGIGLSKEFIGKDDPEYIEKLLALIKKRWEIIFQWYSYMPARILSINPKEKTHFLFDSKVMQLFNSYIKKNNICEFYLFDKQGSYLFLDNEANLSWFFVRNEIGVNNTINLAAQYNAPKSVIDALKEKKVILSLYEREDFERRKHIDWDNYLLPTTILESDSEHLGFFPDLIPSTHKNKNNPKYYYAFANEFPEHGIEKDKILSYKTFLQEN